MSDLDLTKNTNFSQNQNAGSSQNLKGRVVDAGSEMKQRAGDAMSGRAETARDKFKEAADAAKDVASGTADPLQSEAREKQRSGADFMERFAGNIREAARAFENDAPFAARGIDFGRQICRGCRRENPQRKLPRPRRQCDRFRETPARRIPWNLGTRGLCGSAVHQGWKRNLIIVAQRYEPGVIFAAG